MNRPTQSDKTVEQILGRYKKSLTNWASRATNDLPPSNQKGRIVQEIDAEAIADIYALKEKWEREATAELREAWNNKGSHPIYHDNQMRRLETEWPSLYTAVQRLTKDNPKDIT